MSVKKNTIWNLIGTGIPIIIGFLIIPYMIKKIGVESFGILSLVWALIGYFGLFDFGLGRALTQQVSSALKNERENEINEIISSGLTLTAILGILGAIILAILSKYLAYDFLNVTEKMKESTRISLLISAAGIPITTITSGYKGIIEGYEDFKMSNILRVLLGTLNLVLPALSLYFFTPSLQTLIYSLILTRVIILVLHYKIVRKKVSRLDFNLRIKNNTSKDLIKFGAWMSVTNIIGPLMVVSDRFIISTKIGAKLVAYYTVPFDLVIKLLIIPTALSSALFPRFSGSLNNKENQMNILYNRSMKFTIFIMMPICLILILFSKQILKIWLGVDFAENSNTTFSILVIGIFFNCIAQIPFSIIQANGKVKFTAIVHILELVFYLPILFLFLNTFGLLGASIAWTLRTIIDFFIMFFLNKIYNNE